MNTIKDFPEVNDVDMDFGDYPKDWFTKTLATGVDDDDKKWCDLFSKLFYSGGSVPFNKDLPTEYTNKGLRMLKAVMGSFEPKHEDKKVVSAIILKNICNPT